MKKFCVLLVCLSLFLAACENAEGPIEVINNNTNTVEVVTDVNNDGRLSLQDIRPPKTKNPDAVQVYLEILSHLESVFLAHQIEGDDQIVYLNLAIEAVNQLEDGADPVTVEAEFKNKIDSHLSSDADADGTGGDGGDAQTTELETVGV